MWYYKNEPTIKNHQQNMEYNNCDKKNPESKIKNRDKSKIMILGVVLGVGGQKP